MMAVPPTPHPVKFSPTSLLACACAALMTGFFAPPAAVAASNETEFVAELKAALQSQDSAAFAKLCNLEGIDLATQEAWGKLRTAVFALPEHRLTLNPPPDVEKRKAPFTGPDGKTYVINGDLKSILSINATVDGQSRGFSMPVGLKDGKYVVLFAVVK